MTAGLSAPLRNRPAVASSPAAATNPFPVHPVSSLRDIASAILERTVPTGPIEAVDRAVEGYAEATGHPRAGLAMRIRGDYGTGKTHLLIYTEALLRDRCAAAGSRVTVLSVQAKEVPFPAWFTKTVGPLIAQQDLPRIMQGVLADAAIEIADQVRLTLDVAAEIRADPLNVYPALNQGLINGTEVTRALARRIEALTPRSSQELRAVLLALAWPERAAAAVRWLSGRTLDAAEHRLIGVTRDLDAEEEAESVLVAIAGAAGQGSNRFALMVDEFEHLMARDRIEGTSANATAMKRLLEGLNSAGALVLIAGHWSAWELQPDVKARFTLQATIDLVALTGEEVGKLAAKAAPGWHERLGDATLDTIVDAGRFNIRRVLGILHHLYADTVTGSGPIGPATVDLVARRLDEPAATPPVDAMTTIEAAVRASGGKTSRDESVFGNTRFDVVARREGEVRLVANVVHASTSVALSQLLEDFSIAVNAVQGRHPRTHGLLCVSGAVDQAALALLHPLPGIDALASEGPQAAEAIGRLVRGALRAPVDAVAFAPPDLDDTDAVARRVDAYERIREVRQERVQEAEQTRLRLDEVDIGGSERELAATRIIRGVLPPDPPSALGQDRELLDAFSNSMNQQRPTLLPFLFAPGNAGMSATMFLSGLAVPGLLLGAGRLHDGYFPAVAVESFQANVLGVVACAGVALLLSLFLLGRRWHAENRAFVQLHRVGRQAMEELILLGYPHSRLLRLKNELVEMPDIVGGFRRSLDPARSITRQQLTEANHAFEFER